MKTETESKIQQDCLLWFNNNYCLKHHENRGIMFSVPNESVVSNRKSNTGLLRGCSDTVIVFKGKVLFIEFKTPTGSQSPFQKDFESRITKNGFDYFIIRSLLQFKEIISIFEK